jgi:hypothetical protein
MLSMVTLGKPLRGRQPKIKAPQGWQPIVKEQVIKQTPTTASKERDDRATVVAP